MCIGCAGIVVRGQVIITETVRPQQTPRRLLASAPVKVCLFKVTAW